MTVRPDEKLSARAYERVMRGARPRDLATRLLLGPASAYLMNTPAYNAADAIKLGPRHRVLDLGAGRGRVAELLQRRYELVHPPVAVDIAASVVRAAARDLGPDRRVELAVAGATRLPFRDGSFHLIVAAHLFRHLEDETLFRVFLEALRVLKPEGVLLGWEFAPTNSRRLNRLNRALFGPRADEPFCLRGFGAIAPYALYAGFKHVQRATMPLPFLFPPAPRVAFLLQKSADTSAAALDEAQATRLWESRDRAGYDRQP
jgi:SAM-dependent methyltransferase